MKIRNGFVSNSSSSSFLIYGLSFDDFSEMKISEKLLQFLDPKLKEKYSITELKKMLDIRVNGDYDDDDYYDAESYISGFLSDLGLSYENVFDSKYIGRDFESIGDNETGKQFKAKAQEILNVLFNKKVICEVHKEAWRDG